MDDETTLRRKTATLTRMLNHQGTIGMFGHVSVRVPGTNRVLLSPGGGTDKSTVQPDEIFVFDIDGNIVHHPGGLIPLEWRIHTRIHRDRPECMCIAHLHARHATVLGIAGHDVVPVFLHGSFLHGGVPTWNNPRLVVNEDQAADLSRALGDKIAVQMRGHGSVVVGESAEAAFFGCTFLEENASKQLEWVAPSRSPPTRPATARRAPTIRASSSCCGRTTRARSRFRPRHRVRVRPAHTGEPTPGQDRTCRPQRRPHQGEWLWVFVSLPPRSPGACRLRS